MNYIIVTHLTGIIPSNMKLMFLLALTFYVSFVKCTDLNSYEFNHLELTPIHDAIILNDIVDVLNEFENSMKPQLNDHTFSESDEDIENLLSEYQHYLDRAHEQRINYIRKSKGKNKVPLVRHETFTKMKPFERKNYDENGQYYFEDMRAPSVNTLIPHDTNIKLVKETSDLFNTFKNSYYGKKILNFPKLPSENPSESILSSCICKENVIPCKCQCKQCLLPESVSPRKFNAFNPYTNSFKSYKYTEDDPSNNFDNNLNLRIKIDVQFPNISMLSNVLKYRTRKGFEEYEDMIPKETLSTIKFPFPYLNFPTPIDLIGYKQNIFKDKSSPLHKIAIHKKKKFRLNNSNKKHKNKKQFTLHNFESPVQQNITMGYNNNSEINKNNSLDNNEENIASPKNNQYETTLNYTSNNMSLTTQNLNLSNQSLEKIYLTINITKGNDSFSEPLYRSDNSIETDSRNEKGNESSITLLRMKREIKDNLLKFITLNANNNTTTLVPTHSLSNSSKVPYKNSDKESEFNTELLVWPYVNKSQSMIPSKNITAMILDREVKKAKLNMTAEKIRNNHTTALEKAIFGDVNWDDVDAVVPIFISFVGKYITGVLTFCSENVCHSMKCAKKICMHRICIPNNRHNNYGHCAGNNDTDSLATMESIMDLPSNVAFEVINILEEKMIGKLFGKGTLCNNSKCSSFAAFKKTFMKSKCTYKELNPAGHCPNLKNVKVL